MSNRQNMFVVCLCVWCGRECHLELKHVANNDTDVMQYAGGRN